jgi:mannose-6-phosphate isomerase-like protein (cupin superfamily)
MREGPDVLVNALAGERVVFHTDAADTSGDLIRFDLILTKVGGSPPTHIHLHQSEHFSVRSGTIRVMIGDQERLLGAGEQALVPGRDSAPLVERRGNTSTAWPNRTRDQLV